VNHVGLALAVLAAGAGVVAASRSSLSAAWVGVVACVMAVGANLIRRQDGSTVEVGADTQVVLAALVVGLASWTMWLTGRLVVLLMGPLLITAAGFAFFGAFGTGVGRDAALPAKVAVAFGALASLAAVTLLGAPVAVLAAVIGVPPATIAVVRTVRFDRTAVGWTVAGVLLVLSGGGAGVLIIAAYLSSWNLQF